MRNMGSVPEGLIRSQPCLKVRRKPSTFDCFFTCGRILGKASYTFFITFRFIGLEQATFCLNSGYWGALEMNWDKL